MPDLIEICFRPTETFSHHAASFVCDLTEGGVWGYGLMLKYEQMHTQNSKVLTFYLKTK